MADLLGAALINKYVKDTNNNQLNTFKSRKQKKREDNIVEDASIIVLLWSIITWIVYIVLGLIWWVATIIIATRCNPNDKVGYAILAGLFPGVYFAQWAVKKLMMNQEGYCVGI